MFKFAIVSKLENIAGGCKQNHLTSKIAMPQSKQKNDMKIPEHEINGSCW